MAHNILLTGASGYLGGDLLAHLPTASLPPYSTLYALVRTAVQAQAVEKYGASPLTFDVNDKTEIRDAVVKNRITVVFYLIDPGASGAHIHFIDALAEVKKETGKEVHFLHTSGAKIFSSLSGTPTDKPLLDTDPGIYEGQKKSKASALAYLGRATETNNTTIEQAEAKSVRSYIFAPCIVYGKSKGFGNPISIQTVAIVKAAKAAGAVYNPNSGPFTWPVCHVSDNTTLYIRILQAILAGEDIGHGKNGYFLASPGSVAWDDIYSAMAKALAKRGVVKSAEVVKATDENLEKMAEGLGCSKDLVVVQLGGLCTFTAVHGKEIGWKPQYAPEHILEDADVEVELILANL